MIRRSSFLISLIIHILVLALIFFLYSTSTPSKKEQKRVPIYLSKCIVSSCTCSANESVKDKPKEIKQEPPVKQIHKMVKEQPKQLQELKSESVQQTVAQPVVEPSIVKESSKAETPATQSSIQKPSKQEMKTTPTPEKQIPKTSLQQEYVQTNLTLILSMLRENFYYPATARKRGIQGEVVVKFTLCKNREIKDIKVVKDSPEILSQAAIGTIEGLNGKLPAPSQEIVLELPINYKLH
jgi:protein TonB